MVSTRNDRQARGAIALIMSANKNWQKRHCGTRFDEFQAVSPPGNWRVMIVAKAFRTTCMYDGFAPCRTVFRAYRDGLSNIREFLYLGAGSKSVSDEIKLPEDANLISKCENRPFHCQSLPYRYEKVRSRQGKGPRQCRKQLQDSNRCASHP